MKLIIDIPKNEYMKIKRYYDSLPEYSTVEAETYYIAHGTPLDEVKAELEKNSYPIVYGVYNHRKGMTLYGIMQILDNIGKESEDNE